MMTDELKPVNCGCGGEAKIAKKYLMGNLPDVYVLCGNCSIRTGEYYSEAEAVEAWNRAMSGNVQECAKDARCSERTAKVEEAVPNMTILKRKVDLQSIIQAIKTDKIRVWQNYDGKICFRNTKTGNEISVYPYYDMNGEKFDE